MAGANRTAQPSSSSAPLDAALASSASTSPLAHDGSATTAAGGRSVPLPIPASASITQSVVEGSVECQGSGPGEGRSMNTPDHVAGGHVQNQGELASSRGGDVDGLDEVLSPVGGFGTLRTHLSDDSLASLGSAGNSDTVDSDSPFGIAVLSSQVQTGATVPFAQIQTAAAVSAPGGDDDGDNGEGGGDKGHGRGAGGLGGPGGPGGPGAGGGDEGSEGGSTDCEDRSEESAESEVEDDAGKVEATLETDAHETKKQAGKDVEEQGNGEAKEVEVDANVDSKMEGEVGAGAERVEEGGVDVLDGMATLDAILALEDAMLGQQEREERAKEERMREERAREERVREERAREERVREERMREERVREELVREERARQERTRKRERAGGSPLTDFELQHEEVVVGSRADGRSPSGVPPQWAAPQRLLPPRTISPDRMGLARREGRLADSNSSPNSTANRAAMAVYAATSHSGGSSTFGGSGDLTLIKHRLPEKTSETAPSDRTASPKRNGPVKMQMISQMALGAKALAAMGIDVDAGSPGDSGMAGVDLGGSSRSGPPREGGRDGKDTSPDRMVCVFVCGVCVCLCVNVCECVCVSSKIWQYI